MDTLSDANELSAEVQIRVVALEQAVKHLDKNGWQGPGTALDLAMSFEVWLTHGEIPSSDG